MWRLELLDKDQLKFNKWWRRTEREISQQDREKSTEVHPHVVSESANPHNFVQDRTQLAEKQNEDSFDRASIDGNEAGDSSQQMTMGMEKRIDCQRTVELESASIDRDPSRVFANHIDRDPSRAYANQTDRDPSRRLSVIEEIERFPSRSLDEGGDRSHGRVAIEHIDRDPSRTLSEDMQSIDFN